jgi:hypothetical protein
MEGKYGCWLLQGKVALLFQKSEQAAELFHHFYANIDPEPFSALVVGTGRLTSTLPLTPLIFMAAATASFSNFCTSSFVAKKI